MEIYLDESGNLGSLGVDASDLDPYFVLAALIVREDLPIKRCIKDIRKKKIKKRYKNTSELKFADSDDNIKRRILECIGRTNNDIGYALLNKREVGLEPQLIYKSICKQLVYKIIDNYKVYKYVDVFIDKSLYGVQRANFDAYLTDTPSALGEVRVFHVDSKRYPCIQAVDFIAGAISRKYRDDDDLYYQKIQHKVSTRLDFKLDKSEL